MPSPSKNQPTSKSVVGTSGSSRTSPSTADVVGSPGASPLNHATLPDPSKHVSAPQNQRWEYLSPTHKNKYKAPAPCRTYTAESELPGVEVVKGWFTDKDRDLVVQYKSAIAMAFRDAHAKGDYDYEAVARDKIEEIKKRRKFMMGRTSPE